MEENLKDNVTDKKNIVIIFSISVLILLIILLTFFLFKDATPENKLEVEDGLENSTDEETSVSQFFDKSTSTSNKSASFDEPTETCEIEGQVLIDGTVTSNTICVTSPTVSPPSKR